MQPENHTHAPKPFGLLPYDLQRHIMTKFLDTRDRKQYAIDLLHTNFLKDNLKLLPPEVIVKLFVNSIYNKCNNDLCNQSVSMFHISTPANRKKHNMVNMTGPISQYLQCWLDTIYYGFSTSLEQCDQSPVYSFNVMCPEIMTYVPTEGHERLTTNIQTDDFIKFIRIFVCLGERLPKTEPIRQKYTIPISRISRHKCDKVWIEKRNHILYDFVVVLKYLGNKYRNYKNELKVTNNLIKIQNKQDKIAAKEQAKLDKAVAKEQAKLDKAALKEQAKLDKLATIEKAKHAKAAAREQSKQDKASAKEQAKLDKIVKIKELNDMIRSERETKLFLKHVTKYK